MPSRAEPPPYRFVAYGFLAILVLLGAIPGYLALPSPWRVAVVRLACGALVVLACVRLIGRVQRVIDGHVASALDAPPPPARPPVLDERFGRLRDDLRFSTQSWRYFEVFLRPRLHALGGADLPAPPTTRRRRPRGPSMAQLDRVITGIERRP